MKKNEQAKAENAVPALTPLMQQYHEIKARYPGTILFFRLGDFYEMFGEDAKTASRILEVILTQRQGVPMCGIPHHALNSYLRKLVKSGAKVAIAEQMEEPGPGKKIVKRDVVRVITPGTLLEDNLLDAKQNNFLLAISPDESFSNFGIAYADISTGYFGSTQVTKENLKNEIFRISPGEIIVPDNYIKDPFLNKISDAGTAPLTSLEGWLFTQAEAQNKIKQFFKVISLKSFGIETMPLVTGACGAVISYIEKTQKAQMPLLSNIKYHSIENHMLLDETVIKNLELVEGSSSHNLKDSLLESIDMTLTPMGGRLLRSWLLKPLLSAAPIMKRLEAVSFFVEDGIARRALRENIANIADIERILGRLSSGTAGPREIISLKISLLLLPKICENIKTSDKLPTLSRDIPKVLEELRASLNCPDEATSLIEKTINPEPPATLKDGGVIKDGYNADLDELRHISRDSKQLISAMESGERSKTGIGSLKIGYTSVFGYYIEITKSNLGSVPQDYIRKQTVAGGERFITESLKVLEGKILSAEEKILRLEDELFRSLKLELLKYASKLQSISEALSELDVFLSFAENAVLNRYCLPKIDDGFEFDIKEARHPVIEKSIRSGSFAPNDIYLNGDTDQIMILTGPNMAGKSTFLRQNALITILAQIGSYVPASSAYIGLVDRIFTRIGASDNLAGGESTFMVEMHETAGILNQFTEKSLIILDEIGRGTSTYDGISIARATVEYLSQKSPAGQGPKVLFATHYFELTDMSEKIKGVKNFNVAVKEWQGDVVFLHRIVPGAADRSYGIHVAQLAGLPGELIKRARAILNDLEEKTQSEFPIAPIGQGDLFSMPSPKILIELEKIDINNLTPMEAFKLLLEWQAETKKSKFS